MQSRYEQYRSFKDSIPFVLIQNIKRSNAERSPEANWHENIEIELCISGEGRVLIDGKSYFIHSGDMAVINCGSIHHTGSEGGVEYSCIIIDTEFCKDSGIDVRRLCFCNIVSDSVAEEIFRTVCKIYDDKEEPLRVALLRKYILELLILLYKEHRETEAVQAGADQNENAKRAISYIRERYSEHITLDGMARELYINKFVLSRQFKRVVGMTVFEYINSCRCNAAAMLIAEGESVNSAARACGFENMSFFTKTFKRFMGRLPSEYKK